MIEGLKADLESFLDDHPEATEELLLQHFGHPEDYVKEYFSEMSSEELALNLSAKRFRRKLGIIIAAAFLTLVAVLVLWVGIRNSQTAHKYYFYELIEGSTTSLPEGNPHIPHS